MHLIIIHLLVVVILLTQYTGVSNFCSYYTLKNINVHHMYIYIYFCIYTLFNLYHSSFGFITIHMFLALGSIILLAQIDFHI